MRHSFHLRGLRVSFDQEVIMTTLSSLRHFAARAGPVALAVSVFCSVAVAQTTNWTGGSGNWSDSGKWDAGLPGPSSSAVVNGATPTPADVALDASPTIGSLSVGAGNQLRVQNGQRLVFGGPSSTLANNGLIQHEGDGFTWLRIQSDLTVSGTGVIRLNGGAHAINGFGATAAPVLINGPAHTIEGAGRVGTGIDIVNQGLIQANVAGQQLTLDSANELQNSGVVRATHGATLTIFAPVSTGTGRFEAVGPGSEVVFFGNERFEDPTFAGTGGGLVRPNAFNLSNVAQMQNVTNEGLLQLAETDFFGDFANSGTVQVLNARDMRLRTAVTLSGGGTVDLMDGGRIVGDEPLTVVDNTLQGTGTLGAATQFQSQSLIAPGNTADPTGFLDFTSPVSGEPALAIDLGGTLIGGSLPLIGQINRPGLNGSTQFDQINALSGALSIDGLQMSVALADGFTPAPGDFFDVITADQIVLAQAPDLQFPTVTGIAFEAAVLTLPDPEAGSSRDVLRVTATPEPASAGLLLLGAAALLRRRRRAIRR